MKYNHIRLKSLEADGERGGDGGIAVLGCVVPNSMPGATPGMRVSLSCKYSLSIFELFYII